MFYFNLVPFLHVFDLAVVVQCQYRFFGTAFHPEDKA